MILFGIPVWLLSRIFKVIYPFIILVYIVYYNLWNNIDSFQISMLIVYLSLTLIIWILSIHVFKLYHSLWHIFPSKSNKPNFNDEYKAYKTMTNINQYYNECINIPIRIALLQDIFDRDIARIIEGYCIDFERFNINYIQKIEPINIHSIQNISQK